MALRFAPVCRYNPRALLPPVLEGIEAEVRKVGSVWVTENSKNSAFFFGPIFIVHSSCNLSPQSALRMPRDKQIRITNRQINFAF
jgi:hypothetical protein